MDQIGKTVNAIIAANPDDTPLNIMAQIRAAIVSPHAYGDGGVVRSEWINEPVRRQVLKQRAEAKKDKKQKIGRKGSFGRRIIRVFEGSRYSWEYHATKGWRHYRRAA